MKDLNWKILTILIIITLHLQIFKVSNFGISLSLILLPIWVLKTFYIDSDSFTKREMILLLTIIFLPFLSFKIEDFNEFYKTYFQFVLSYFFVIKTYKKKIKIDLKTIDHTLKIIQIILLVTVVFQFIVVVILGKFDFYNIFGKYQLYYELDYYFSKGRMKAFYLEPSFLGFVLLNIYWTRKHINNYNNILNENLILSIIPLFFVRSAFAYYGIIIIILFDKFYDVKKRLNIIALFSILILGSLIIANSSTLYSIFRIEEFIINPDEQISSSYLRILLPFEVIYKLIFIDGHYLGLPFGDLDFYVENFFIEYGEKKLNNSFFLIMGYFGIPGIIFNLYLIYKGLRMKKSLFSSFIILSLINLNNSGAFVTIQYIILSFLIPYLILNRHENKIINNNGSPKRQRRSN